MTPEDELKARAQAESVALQQIIVKLVGDVARQAGELAVLKARLEEKPEA